LLARRDVTFQHTKTWRESTDPEYDAKLDRIEHILYRFPDRTFAFDGYGRSVSARPQGPAGQSRIGPTGSRRPTSAHAPRDLPDRQITNMAEKKAIVLDVDDTSLSTYNYELETTFVYNPTSNAQYIATKTMPAVFGMNTLAKWAEQQGYTVFFVTGRPESQRSYTAANLAAVGFPTPDASRLYLKNEENPPT